MTEPQSEASAASMPPRRNGTPAIVQSHLDTAQRSRQHQVVEVSQMTDAERASLEAAEPGAERHVESFEDDRAKPVGIVGFRHHHGGEDGAVLVFPRARDVELPGGHRGTRRGREPLMALEDVRQAFLFEHRERFAETKQQVRGRRIGEESRRVGRQHLLP